MANHIITIFIRIYTMYMCVHRNFVDVMRETERHTERGTGVEEECTFGCGGGVWETAASLKITINNGGGQQKDMDDA